MRPSLKPALALLLALSLSAPLPAQEIGYWHAANPTARTITGDITIAADRLGINLFVFTIANIRPLTPVEIAAAFYPDPTPPASVRGAATLYRLQIPATQKFLRKNTLCGSDDTKWMVTFVSAKSLTIDFFSDDKPPTFTHEALTDSPNLCGTFTYTR